MKTKRAIESIGAFFFCLMIVLVLIQIVARYIFSSPPPWTEEFARWSMICSVLVFSIIITKENDHILMDYFINKLPAFLKNILEFMISGILSVFCFLMAYSGVKLMQTSVACSQEAPGSGIPLYLIYSILPVAFVLMGAVAFFNLFKAGQRREK
ncbi:MAG: TRAP transporter small permease [Thermovirgaceae bacterium]